MTLEEIRGLCDGATFQNARRIVASGAVQETSRTDTGLFAQVKGTRLYTVAVRLAGDKITARCTCPAARFTPICKHAAAVLILWVESPERFVLGSIETVEERRETGPSLPRARREKVERSELQAQSVLQALKLALLLAREGMLNAPSERIDQLRQVAENLSALKARRLAQAVEQITALLRTASDENPPVLEQTYAELLTGLWLTARALQEHYSGRRPLPDVQREEMLGHTWRDRDLEIREGVRLTELAYENRITPTGFRLDISHLIDLDHGTLYREMKIVPLNVPSSPADYKPPRPRPFLAHRIGIYPGYAPRRIKIFSDQLLPDLPDVRAVLEPYALRSVHALRAAAWEHMSDPFAPPSLTALVAPAKWVWWRGRAWLADKAGELFPLWIRTIPEHLQKEERPLEHGLLAKDMPLLFGYLQIDDGELGFLPISAIAEDGVGLLRWGIYPAAP